MVHVDTIAACRQISGSSQLAWSKGRQPPGAVLHSSNEAGELSQWLCNDDNTTAIVLGIILLLLSHQDPNKKHTHIYITYITTHVFHEPSAEHCHSEEWFSPVNRLQCIRIQENILTELQKQIMASVICPLQQTQTRPSTSFRTTSITVLMLLIQLQGTAATVAQ